MQAELLTPRTRSRLNNVGISFSKQRVAPTAIFPVPSFTVPYTSSHCAYFILFFATDF